MRRLFWMQRLLAALFAAVLTTRAWSDAFAAIGDSALAVVLRDPLLDAVREASPDELQRFVLVRFAQGCAMAFAALFFFRSVYRSVGSSRNRTLANAVALIFFGCAGSLLVYWGLGYTVLTYFGKESA